MVHRTKKGGGPIGAAKSELWDKDMSWVSNDVLTNWISCDHRINPFIPFVKSKECRLDTTFVDYFFMEKKAPIPGYTGTS